MGKCAFNECDKRVHPELGYKIVAPFLGRYYNFCSKNCANFYNRTHGNSNTFTRPIWEKVYQLRKKIKCLIT